MPGFMTHYLFGRDAYQKMDGGPQKRIISLNAGAYGLGLQGPDIFFYYLPSYLIHGRNLGSVAHTEATAAFFRALLDSASYLPRRSDREIAEAYISGFLGHYVLDTTCHPFVYARTRYSRGERDYFSRHAYLETDIDRALLKERLGCLPSGFHARQTIALSRRQKKIIATMLYDAYRAALPRFHASRATMRLGIAAIQLGTRALHDASGKKKTLARIVERYVPGYPIFSPLIASDTLTFTNDPFNEKHAEWTNPWDDSIRSTESFYDLYDKAMDRYLAQVKKLHALLHTWRDADAYQKRFKDFLHEYQNLSFHSGLDVSIPS